MTNRIGPTGLRILAAIMQAQSEGKPPPSMRQISRDCEMAPSTNGVSLHLHKLEMSGLIARKSFRARAITLKVRFVPANSLDDLNRPG